MITLIVDGLPTPWTAARISPRRPAFNPKYKQKQYARWQVKSQFNQEAPISAPVKASYTFHMPIPKNASKVRRLQMLNDKIHHICRPDIDNLQKFISDCLTGIVFIDDSQLVEVRSRKIFGERPQTIIQIEAVL